MEPKASTEEVSKTPPRPSATIFLAPRTPVHEHGNRERNTSLGAPETSVGRGRLTPAPTNEKTAVSTVPRTDYVTPTQLTDYLTPTSFILYPSAFRCGESKRDT